MRLTAQDKLALALTSYGSMQALADDLGVARSTVSRWLREGQRDDNGKAVGVRSIPDYAASAIDTVFEIHRDIAKEQARIDKLPFNAAAPVFAERKRLRTTGEKGERVAAEHTQFIRPDLRVQTIAHAAKSKKYLQASVRSTIDLKRYFKARALELARERGYREDKGRINQLASSMLNSFVEKERRQKNRIIDKGEPFPLFTQYENISPIRSDPIEAALGVEDKLRKKHEPATGGNNTALADSFLFQLMPRPNAIKQTTARAKPRRNRASDKRNIRGAGPK